MTVRAVLFDLYETLITEFSEGKRKVPRTPLAIERLGITIQQYADCWSERQSGRMSGVFPDYPSVMRDIVQSCGVEPDETVIEELHKARIIEKAAAFKHIPDSVIGMLTELKRQGLKLALVSNCTPEEVTAWPDCPLAAYFDTVVFSFAAGAAKPDSRIYALACGKLGVSPAETIFVGDGGSSELEGAREAGLMAYRARWYQLNKQAPADFPLLLEPKELLAALRTG